MHISSYLCLLSASHRLKQTKQTTSHKNSLQILFSPQKKGANSLIYDEVENIQTELTDQKRIHVVNRFNDLEDPLVVFKFFCPKFEFDRILRNNDIDQFDDEFWFG